MGDINNSFSNFEVALGIYRNSVRESHPNVTKVMQYFLTILLKVGKMKEAHYYVKRVLEIRQKELRMNYKETGKSLYDEFKNTIRSYLF